ncbi:MAG: hypothetical protein RL681_831, partial [Candidatus Parcubacteria bacterium]
AEFLESEFEPEFMIQDIVNLPNYNIYLKLMVDGIACRPFSAATLPPLKVKSSATAIDEIIESSRKKYARPRRVIEDEINAWSGIMTVETPEGTTILTESTAAEGGRFRATCSNCSKSIMLSFEPMPGRPVYCKACLAKVKSGEILSAPRQASLRSRQKYSSDLAGLGIEFSERKESPMPQRSSFQSALSKQDMVEVVRKPEGRPMSLAQLQQSDAAPKKKHEQSGGEIDIAELQKEIAASLERSLDEPET